ncbi:MAG: hypothetical protein EOP50_03555 [Sphingobacteriales bacterium]|nr:MAG: hypothetical protein EOP50_03555 [Sphingobacteriales bacterium]
METLKELLESIRLQASDRVSNPLTGAFLLAWPIVNFRFILVLVGDGEWMSKITYIEANLYPEWKLTLVNGLLIPLAFALFYVFLYPPIAHRIVKLHKARRIVHRKEILDLEGDTPLTQENARKLREGIARERIGWRSQRDQLQIEVSDLAALNATMKTEVENLRLSDAAIREELRFRDAQDREEHRQRKTNVIWDDDKESWRFAPGDFLDEPVSTQLNLANVGVSERAAGVLKALMVFPGGADLQVLSQELKLKDSAIMTDVLTLEDFELVHTDRSSGKVKIALSNLGYKAAMLLVPAMARI